jgi:hypothetical protein
MNFPDSSAMGWRLIALSAEERGTGAGEDLKVDFEIAVIAAAVPEAAALFIESAERDEFLYFSPEASRIFRSRLDAVRAEVCPPPQQGKVNIAVGHQRAVSLLRAP